jgi:hypothetical protein
MNGEYGCVLNIPTGRYVISSIYTKCRIASHRKDIMEQKIPDSILSRWSNTVLDFVRNSSVHADVAEALLKAVKRRCCLRLNSVLRRVI